MKQIKNEETKIQKDECLNDEDILNDIKDRDNIKTTYCCTNHIDLLIIPYWEFNNIENILKNKLFT